MPNPITTYPEFIALSRLPGLNYKPAQSMALTFALIDFWTMLDNGWFAEAARIYTWLAIEQAKRAEIASVDKSWRYIDRALSLDEMREARDEAKKVISWNS